MNYRAQWALGGTGEGLGHECLSAPGTRVPIPEHTSARCTAPRFSCLIAQHLPLIEKGQMLCAGCGAVVARSIDPCSCCGAAGKALGMFGIESKCPYCGTGEMHYASMAD